MNILTRFTVVILGLLMLASSFASAGSLGSPAAPSNADSAMFTLEGIYNLIGSGTSPTMRTEFTEPTAAPGPTGHTLTELKTLIDSRAHATCDGTLFGTRWCRNESGGTEDGTVTDLTTGLIWLKAANWGGSFAFWAAASGTQNAHDRAASLTDAGNGALADSSVEGDWRLPTKKELVQLTNSGTEDVSPGSQRAFTGVQSSDYWSSTTDVVNTSNAWVVNLDIGFVSRTNKTSTNFVWPVRGGQ